MKRRFLRWCLIPLGIVLVVVLFSMVRVQPHEVGVRINNFGLGSRGVVPKDFGPGWHLNIPLAHTWHTFPARIRRVELTRDSRQRSSLGTDSLIVQSSDGDRVLVDLNVFYRLKPGAAHRVLQDSGPGDGHVRALKTLASDRLRAVLGKLRTEEFYAPRLRKQRAAEALQAMRVPLGHRFLEVVDVQIQDFQFEPKYEQKIKDKKLADQQVELNKAQVRAAAEKAKVGAIQIETTKKVKLIETQAEAEAARIKAEAEKYAAEKRASADLYREQLRARGDLALAQARARVTRAKSTALQGRGGANVAALEAVRQLKIDTIAFPTGGRDWFDVREMATRLGARP